LSENEHIFAICSEIDLKMDVKTRFDRKEPYNQLPRLPPSKEIINKEILIEWGLASRNLAALNKNLQRLPDPLMLVNTISLREAKSSSEIENIFTTDDELYKAISETIREENTTGAAKEVLRYREALWTGFYDMKEKGSITMETLVKVFQQIKNTQQRNRSPQSKIVIKLENSEFRSGEVIYTPPRGEGIVEDLLENLVAYLAGNDSDHTDPLIKMAISHYQFEAIHPFSDGNGRTGRILNLLYLVNQDLLTLPVLYLSKYIIENKIDYYYNLGTVSQRGDWTKWIIYMMKAVSYTSVFTNRLIDEILEQMDVTLDYAKAKMTWYNKEVNELLFKQPYFKPALLNRVLKRTSRTTLTKYMNELIGLGIVSPKRDGKEVYYLNIDLIRILEE